MAEILIGSIKKGEAGGVAELDASGRVPSTQLPSYVDDVLEFANLAAFPATGEVGKIYIVADTNKTYRWSGAGYAEISASLALGTTSATAFRGDHGQIAYTHTQAQGNPHNLKASDIIKAGKNIQLATNGTVSATDYDNVPIGIESGKVVHIDDAWSANAIRVMISGKSVQNGTPKPDAPVEVDVVDGPVSIVVSVDNTAENGTTYAINLPADHDYLASLPDGAPDGTRDELVLRADGVAVLVTRTAKIASYAGENVTTLFMSTTGALTTGATVIYNVPPMTKYSADNGATWLTTDPAAGQSAIPLHKGTNNVWCPDPLSPEISLDYVQDTNKVINELRVDITDLEAAWDSASQVLYIGAGTTGNFALSQSISGFSSVDFECYYLEDDNSKRNFTQRAPVIDGGIRTVLFCVACPSSNVVRSCMQVVDVDGANVMQYYGRWWDHGSGNTDGKKIYIRAIRGILTA